MTKKKENRKAKLKREVYINDFYICILRNNYNRKRTIRKTVKQNKKLEKGRRKVLFLKRENLQHHRRPS